MAELCYVLAFPDGRWIEDPEHGEPHFPDEATARERAPMYGDDAVNLATPKRLDEPCVTISCHECDYLHDEEDAYIVHFESREEALKSVRDFGWTVRGDVAHCPGCPPDEAPS